MPIHVEPDPRNFVLAADLVRMRREVLLGIERDQLAERLTSGRDLFERVGHWQDELAEGLRTDDAVHRDARLRLEFGARQRASRARTGGRSRR